VPPNTDGFGYVCYSLIGQDRALTPATHPAVQDIEGALDLDILPAINGRTITAGRIWCAAGTPVRAVATIDQAGWVMQKSMSHWSPPPAAGAELQAHTAEEGFFSDGNRPGADGRGANPKMA